MILFVCTGNTCRSAMAEAFARRHGVEVASAGLAATVGDPATPATVEVMSEIGFDITDHEATPFASSAASADHIYVMTEAHRQRILRDFPSAAHRTELLDPAGDIDDPWQGDLDLYRATRDRIGRLVDERLGAAGTA